MGFTGSSRVKTTLPSTKETSKRSPGSTEGSTTLFFASATTVIVGLSHHERAFARSDTSFSLFNQGIFHAVHERLQAGFNDVATDAHGSPFVFAVTRFDQHARGRPGA